ncbi:hypothetical protein IWW55_000079 [Coemansia sp. RSA 2706]|nr:hypothetical protein LPJ63_001288 [Coemansia sp. RSA 2711]KAJ2308988.1 hypothetical protein IWW55_000079 [Coemansia sp. RSA 2706]KAJ2315711.1 hypothetical protein IWW54_000080 [Coemansia sp. RSA 2705]KAJ2330210.1 hypothetical protein IWW51_000070 [Coemansia sp. RSA 2702]KAJ2739971.1 hypothetical protein H4R23_000069 [Coemansia sp. Cherry 401B]
MGNVPSNLPLVHSTASGSFVKRLLIVDDIPNGTQALLTQAEQLLALSSVPWLGVTSIHLFTRYSPGSLGLQPPTEAEAAQLDASAKQISRLLPSVNAFTAISSSTSATTDYLLSAMLQAYAKSLLRLRIVGEHPGARECDALSLRSLSLTSLKRPLPTAIKVDPANLTSLDLFGAGVDYGWGRFLRTSNGSVSFDNLTRLTLYNNRLHPSELAPVTDEILPTLLFPRLEYVYISGADHHECQYRMFCAAKSLQTVIVSGTNVDMRAADLIGLPSVTKLRLRFDIRDGHTIKETGFIDKANRLLARVKAIAHVEMALVNIVEPFSVASAQWLCLTSLDMPKLSTMLYYVFKLTSTLSSVRRLRIGSLRSPRTDEYSDPSRYLRDLRTRTMHPSTASLERFTMNHCPLLAQDYLDEHIALLKWYLPNLAHIIIPCK